MTLPLADFHSRLLNSGILAPDQLGTLEILLASGSAPASGEDLARWLVNRKLLTAYQAQALYQGKGKQLVLGNYLVLDKLGQGGMGMVLKARHRRMDRLVALKVLSPALVKTKDLVGRFQREVKAAARLSHPNIVTAYDADEVKGTHFLVMEYVPGTDLGSLVRQQGMLPVAAAIEYTLQTARGLDYAHRQGIIHRDIKPANLLVDREGTVKILDMGLARIEALGQAETELTNTGSVMGTVDYMSPEQAISSKTADARADQYSLGCTLYFLLTAKHVYDGDTLMAKLLHHRETPPPSLREARPEVPAALDAIFRKLVAKQPAERYASMAALVEELLRLKESTSAAPQAASKLSEDSQLNEFLANRAVARKPPAPTAAPAVQPAPATQVQTAVKTEPAAPSFDATVSLAAPLTETLASVPSPQASAAQPAQTQPSQAPSAQVQPTQPKPAQPRPAAVRRHWRQQPGAWLAIGSAALLLVGLAAMAPFLLRVETEAGTIILEVDQPGISGAEVTVDGQQRIFLRPGKDQEPIEITADAKQHTLRVSKGGFETLTKEFTVKAGTTQTVKLHLEPKQVAATKPAPPVTGEANSPAAESLHPQRRAALAVLKAGGKLELQLSGTQTLSIATLDELPAASFLINNIELNNLPQVGDEIIPELSGLHYLPRFELRNTKVTSEGLRRFGDLQLNAAYLVGAITTDDTASTLATSGVSALALEPLATVGNVSPDGLRNLVRVPTLDWFQTRLHPESQPAQLQAIAELRALRRLQLQGRPTSPAGMEQLAGLPHLRWLEVQPQELTDEWVSALSRLQNLRVLNLWQTTADAERLQRLRSALPDCVVHQHTHPPAESERTALQWVLDHGGQAHGYAGNSFSAALPAVPDEPFFVHSIQSLPGQPEGLTPLSQFRGLENLATTLLLGDIDVEPLTSLPGLNNPWLNAPDLTPAGLVQIARLSGIRCLGLEGVTKVAPDDWRHIQPLQLLNRLGLHHCRVGDSGLEHISKLPSVQVLSLNGSEDITADGLRHLAGMPLLRELSLRGIPLDDAAVPHLQKLTSLRRLDLEKTNITPAGIDALQQALPKCAIFTDQGLRLPGTAPALGIDYAAERAAAEWVLSVGGRVELVDEQGQGVPLINGELPPEPFVVRTVGLLDGRQITDDGLAFLGGCGRLEAIQIIDAPQITARGLRHLKAATHLRTLELLHCSVGRDLVSLLTHWPQLRRLDLRPLAEQRLKGADLLAFPPLPELRSLDIPFVDATDAELTQFLRQHSLLEHVGLSHEGLPVAYTLTLVRELPNLHGLFLTGNQLTPEVVEVLRNPPRLRQMLFHGANDETLQNIVDIGAVLEELYLALHGDGDQVPTATGYEALSRLPALQGLTLTGPHSPSDAELAILANCRSLRTLQLKYAANLCRYTAAGIEAFRKARPDVHLYVDGQDYPPTTGPNAPPDYAAERAAAEWVLSVGGYVELKQPDDTKLLLREGPVPPGDWVLHLAALRDFQQIRDDDLKRFASCRQLSWLALDGTPITGIGLKQLESLSSLRKLDLMNCKLTDETAAFLAPLRQLKILRVDVNHLSDRGLIPIGQLTNLEVLSIGTNRAVTDAGVAHLHGLTQLRDVGIYDTQITDAGLATLIARNPELKSVALGLLTSAGITHTAAPLAQAGNLEVVSLPGELLTESAIPILKQHPRLQRISMGSTISAEAVARLVSVTNVRDLHLAFYFAPDPGPGDAGYAALAKHPTLTDLAIGGLGQSPTDTTLASLAKLPQLKRLTLDFSEQHHPRNYTAAGIAEFRELRPDVHLKVDGVDYPPTTNPHAPSATP